MYIDRETDTERDTDIERDEDQEGMKLLMEKWPEEQMDDGTHSSLVLKPKNRNTELLHSVPIQMLVILEIA